jgi:hypothetical protein
MAQIEYTPRPFMLTRHEVRDRQKNFLKYFNEPTARLAQFAGSLLPAGIS